MDSDPKSECRIAGDSETFYEMEGRLCSRFMWFWSGFWRGNYQGYIIRRAFSTG
jgi:hypothetical protein